MQEVELTYKFGDLKTLWYNFINNRGQKGPIH